ncbi:Multicopper oxidase, type 3,Multicopper oxidases, conserved site,Cupredoxin,Multicopper oxidase [Cinara cedri]|uniref:Multicopper oxidase, type 3,Multicopper oxidases, conserved site,Cupredoxin,Multicopper oxidase n=2 Tax=Cinara cedri TaxID=506608 RepID=A0A5E4MKC8_9HEMI|nr:Multicopper oxidase, type 3,Multicopper oxidases, conserved site,Cupredoxin,Multicopper oxidase [Cinara cedri]
MQHSRQPQNLPCLEELIEISSLLSFNMCQLYSVQLQEASKVNCDRECHELDWPLICRFRIVLESQQIQNNCQKCSDNQTECQVDNMYCDRYSEKVITANRQVPGPSIRVCENDIMVIDVVNRIPGHSVSVHWRGQWQKETPVMDGSPMVTQCPILPHTTFQYKFRAAQPGTHWWQILSGDELSDRVFGAFIVKQSKRREPHVTIYDHDDIPHVLLVEYVTSQNGSNEMRVNGNAPSNTTITVKNNGRYRFRTINTGGLSQCPIEIKAQEHFLTAIAIDGHAIEPVQVEAVQVEPGETLDFVLTASKNRGIFNMTVSSGGHCEDSNLTHTLHIQYNSTLNDIILEMKNPKLSVDSVVNHYVSKASLSGLPWELSANKLKNTIYLGFSSIKYQLGEGSWSMPNFNNMSMVLPSAPLLLQQPQDVVECNSENVPFKCRSGFTSCECTHIIDLPLGSATELVVFDTEHTLFRADRSHSFHLHGHSFHVVGEKRKAFVKSAEHAKKLDNEGRLLRRNFEGAALKNTVVVPAAGVSAVRFVADNPGYWLFRSESTSEWSSGLSLIFRVANPTGSFPKVPEDFPKCGNFIGPEFFLT